MNIKLPNFIIADLYKNSLVVLNEEPVQATESPAIAATIAEEAPFYLGNNTQHICIVLSSALHQFMDEESKQLLSNLLAALNYTLADVAIVNHYRTPVLYDQISEVLKPRVCLLFGITTEALQLPMIIPNYQLQGYEDCTFIQACSIDVMKANDDNAKAEKRKLWTCLKTVFNR